MGKVHQVDFTNKRKREYHLDQCAGCHKDIQEEEGYFEVVLPYDDYDKYIALCEKCGKTARKQGIF